MVLEGEGHKGGPPEIVQVCVGCSNATGVDKKLNVRHPEGGQTHVLPFLTLFSGSSEEW